MGGILTAEQVEVVRKYGVLPGMGGAIKAVCDSHDMVQSLYDALLAGATAQRVATLMDEADKARVEIARLREDFRTLEPCGHAKNFLIGDERGHFTCTVCRIAELEKERDAQRDAKHEAESQLASVTDLLNSWARESYVTEARDERGIKSVINGLWMAFAQMRIERDASVARRDEILVSHDRYLDELAQMTKARYEKAIAERDGLRGELAALGRETAVTLERDGLRRAIESAPHGDCWVGLQGRECDCWKSRALAAVPASEDLK